MVATCEIYIVNMPHGHKDLTFLYMSKQSQQQHILRVTTKHVPETNMPTKLGAYGIYI